jgi:putative ABC transport system permease protein
VLGIGLGAGLAVALTGTRQSTVAFPVSQLLIYILATGAAGVLASIGPARRAARLNMLQAISAE